MGILGELNMEILEEWKEIPAYPKYMASNLGRIKNKKTGKIKKPFLSKHGYPQASIQLVNGKKNIHIHSLVLQTFKGDRPINLESNHKDGNKLNNNVENLEYITKSQNCIHAFRMNLRRPRSQKLEKKDVLDIRHFRKSEGVTTKELCKEYGVTQRTIRHIIEGKTWCYI
jgi:hypothetical protein